MHPLVPQRCAQREKQPPACPVSSMALEMINCWTLPMEQLQNFAIELQETSRQ